jgi:hypothetical protein
MATAFWLVLVLAMGTNGTSNMLHVGNFSWPAPGLDDTDLSEPGPALELHRA